MCIRPHHRPVTTSPSPFHICQGSLRTVLDGGVHNIFYTLGIMGLYTQLVHSLVLYAQSLAKASSRHTLCCFVVALLHL